MATQIETAWCLISCQESFPNSSQQRLGSLFVLSYLGHTSLVTFYLGNHQTLFNVVQLEPPPNQKPASLNVGFENTICMNIFFPGSKRNSSHLG